MSEQKSGKILLLRFAFRCVPELLSIRKITQDDSDSLESLIKRNLEPAISLLETCFKYAVKSYRKTCKDSGIEADFSYESVLNHLIFRHNRDHFGDCATMIANVIEVRQTVSVIAGSEKFDVENPYNIELEELVDTVLIHRKAIICKL